MKQTSFDATISALDVETSAFGAATSAIARWSFDATISALDVETSLLDAETSSLDVETSALDAETSVIGAATSVIARSYQRYRHIVSGDCRVGITPQMCNRVTNHGDMSTFSKPVLRQIIIHSCFIPLSKKYHFCYISKSIILVSFQKASSLFRSNFQYVSFLLRSKKRHSYFVPISEMYHSCYVT